MTRITGICTVRHNSQLYLLFGLTDKGTCRAARVRSKGQFPIRKISGFYGAGLKNINRKSASTDGALHLRLLRDACDQALLIWWFEMKPGFRSNLLHRDIFGGHDGKHAVKLLISGHAKKPGQ